jgi:hypothetical protein
MYVDNDFIWWISPRSLAIYFQLNFFLKVTKNHLVMLPRNWTTYIPRRDALPAVPTPTIANIDNQMDV